MIVDAMEMIYERRSIRAYADRPVERGVLEKVLSAALMAPSWKNTQTAGYVVVESEEMKRKVLAALPAFNAKNAESAPVIVVLTTITGRAGFERDGSFSTTKGDRWQTFDAGIACQTLCLAAKTQGLGTCIMGLFDEDQLREVLGLPEDQIVSAVVPMGYPAVDPAAPKRKTLEERVTYV